MMPELKWDVGSSLPYERPIYQFSKFIEKQYESGVIAGTTAKNYFSCVVRFYTHHLKFNYPFQGGVPVEYTETIIKKYDNDLTSHITGLEIKVLSADCKPNIGSSKRTELIPFNDKEKKLFFSTLVDNGSEELLLICLLAYNSGMRADEIADFRVDMISRYSGQDEFILRLGPVSGHRTKKNSEMPVEVNGRIIALLLRYNKSKRYLNRLKKTKPDRANVFLDKNGKPYTQKMISTLFNEFMRDYIKTIDPDFYHKFHDLRVSFGVIIMKTCIDAGWKRSESLAYTKKQMRHQKVETTQLYLEYWESSIAIKKQALANEEVLEDVYQMLENT
jgi:integrase